MPAAKSLVHWYREPDRVGVHFPYRRTGKDVFHIKTTLCQKPIQTKSCVMVLTVKVFSFQERTAAGKQTIRLKNTSHFRHVNWRAVEMFDDRSAVDDLHILIPQEAIGDQIKVWPVKSVPVAVVTLSRNIDTNLSISHLLKRPSVFESTACIKQKTSFLRVQRLPFVFILSKV